MRNFINIITEAEANNTGNAVDDPDIEDLGGPAPPQEESRFGDISEMSYLTLYNFLLHHHQKGDYLSAANMVGDTLVKTLREVWPRTEGWHDWAYSCSAHTASLTDKYMEFRVDIFTRNTQAFKGTKAPSRRGKKGKDNIDPIQQCELTMFILHRAGGEIRVRVNGGFEAWPGEAKTRWIESNWNFKTKFARWFRELDRPTSVIGEPWPYFEIDR